MTSPRPLWFSVAFGLIFCVFSRGSPAQVLSTLGVSTPPVSTPAPPEKPKFSLAMRDGRVSLSAREADPGAVLEDLSTQAGFALSVYERPSQSLTVEMKNVTIEDCLKKILPSYSFVYRKGKGGDPILQSVAVFRVGQLALLSAPQSGRTIAYGSLAGQIGSVSISGVERHGPASFAADEGGNIYVCDTVNGRIKAFSPEGKLNLNVPAPDLPADIALDGEGNIFVLDSLDGRVSAFDPSGKALGSIGVPSSVLSRSQNIRAIRGRVILLGRDQEEFDLGALENGELTARESVSPAPGLRSESGRSFTARRVSDSLAELKIGGERDNWAQTVGLPIPRLASIAVLGEDAIGYVYLQVEQSRGNGPGVDLGVIKYTPEMNPVAMIEKIPNNYVSWTARLLQINRAGDVFQMLPGPDGVALNRWNWEKKEKGK